MFTHGRSTRKSSLEPQWFWQPWWTVHGRDSWYYFFNIKHINLKGYQHNWEMNQNQRASLTGNYWTIICYMWSLASEPWVIQTGGWRGRWWGKGEDRSIWTNVDFLPSEKTWGTKEWTCQKALIYFCGWIDPTCFSHQKGHQASVHIIYSKVCWRWDEKTTEKIGRKWMTFGIQKEWD